MKKKKEKIGLNTAQSRLEDLKSEYNYIKKMLEVLMNDIDSAEEMVIHNGNNTLSVIPAVKTFGEFVTKKQQLTKVINEMEKDINNGYYQEEEDDNPFS